MKCHSVLLLVVFVQVIFNENLWELGVEQVIMETGVQVRSPTDDLYSAKDELGSSRRHVGTLHSEVRVKIVSPKEVNYNTRLCQFRIMATKNVWIEFRIA